MRFLFPCHGDGSRVFETTVMKERRKERFKAIHAEIGPHVSPTAKIAKETTHLRFILLLNTYR